MAPGGFGSGGRPWRCAWSSASTDCRLGRAALDPLDRPEKRSDATRCPPVTLFVLPYRWAVARKRKKPLLPKRLLDRFRPESTCTYSVESAFRTALALDTSA